jgi:hypothetical protein
MSTSKLATVNRRRGLAGAAAVLGVAGALAFGLAPAANAATSDGPQAKQIVTVTVTQKGNYTATYCVGDNLEARCEQNVRKGQSRTFTVKPGKGEPVSVSVLANGGGSAFQQIVTDGRALRFDAAGSKAKPTIVRR